MQNANEIQNSYNEKGYFEHKPTDFASADEWKKFDWLFSNSALNTKEASFFEIGPGPGTFYNYLKAKDITKYQAVDANINVIKAFNKYFPERPNLVVQGNAIEFLENNSTNKYDCVVASMILEHLEDNDFMKLFSLIEKNLNPGGEFWINVPCAESILYSYSRYFDLTHKRSFTVNNFSFLAEMFNLKITAKTGKVIAITNFKTFLKYMHNQLIYWINRFLFAFAIGIHGNIGVFSEELTIVLKKAG